MNAPVGVDAVSLDVQALCYTWTSDRSLRVGAPPGEGGVSTSSARWAECARQLGLSIERDGLGWIEEVVPSAASVLVVVDPRRVATAACERAVREAVNAADAQGLETREGSREVVIPVCYDGEFGPDLSEIASGAGLSCAQAIELHASGAYVVECIGFSPGFGYLAGLPRDLHAPRLGAPRTRVPAGSVGIAGAKTGVYPQGTPGGWRLIGRTPLVMFDATREYPSLLAAGDRVRFSPISREEFDRQWRASRPAEHR